MVERHPHGESRTDALESIILSELGSGETITMDQLMLRLPGLSWGEMFFALDALSRRGGIVMRRRGYEYEVRGTGSRMESHSNNNATA